MKKFRLGIVCPQSLESLRTFLQENKGKITITFNSEGGSLKSALEMYSLIQQHGNVTGIVETKADSAALIVLQGCSLRKAHRASTFLFHPAKRETRIIYDAFVDAESLLEQVRRLLEDMQVLQQKALKILAHKTRKRARTLERLCREKRILSTQEALGLKFIDTIITRARKT